MNIDNLVLEITRKCNLKCDHCLRGRAQNKTMQNNVIYETLHKIDYISTLTLTGGEPSLAASTIEEIVQQIIWSKCEVGNFYIVTNAKYITERFMESLHKLFNICSDNEISQIQYSSDNFHYDQKHINRLEEYFNEELYLTNGCGDFLVSPKGEINYDNVINQGNAAKFGLGTKENSDYPFIGRKWDGEITLSDTELYINVNGDIIKGCDWSYEEQENRKLGNILTMSNDDLIKTLEKNNLIEWEE